MLLFEQLSINEWYLYYGLVQVQVTHTHRGFCSHILMYIHIERIRFFCLNLYPSASKSLYDLNRYRAGAKIKKIFVFVCLFLELCAQVTSTV